MISPDVTVLRLNTTTRLRIRGGKPTRCLVVSSPYEQNAGEWWVDIVDYTEGTRESYPLTDLQGEHS